MTWELILLAISFLILWILMDNYFPSKKHPPGPLRFPILGGAIALFRLRHKPPFIMFRDFNRKYGPVAYIRMGAEPTVLIDDFDTAKTLLNSETWIDRPFNSFMAERSYGKPLGIIFVGGEGWREMRRFSMRTLKDFGFGKQTDMQQILDDEIKSLLEKLERISSQPEPVLKMKHLFTMPVLNLLWNMISSVRSPDDDEKLQKLVILVDDLTKATPIGGSILDIFPSLRHVFPGMTGATFIRQCITGLQDYFQEILDARRKEGVDKEENRDFIDAFIKEIERHEKLKSNPNLYTDEQFITTIMDLFEAGSETSRNTLEFAFYYAMKNPRVQKKVQEEIDRVVGRNRLPTVADRPKMPYTEATLIEVQRMANVLPMTVRSPTENCNINGYFIEKGAVGIVNIYSIHMDKKFWGDPFVFRPERFLDDNNQIIMSIANRVIPFGAGKRVCIGEQMARTTLFSYFTALLQSYSFEDVASNVKAKQAYSSEEEQEVELFDKIVHVGFTLTPNPYEVKLVKRL